MKIVNMHDAKTNLSRLVDAAVGGEGFVIARAGTPLVQVTPIVAAAPRRTGFLKGQIDLPADFDTMGRDEIAALFDGAPDDAAGQGDDAEARHTGGREAGRTADERGTP